METLDLMVAIERYIVAKGLSHNDSIMDLINALSEDAEEDF